MGKSNKLIGKIGWCDKDVLHLSKGHYVFIRNVQKGKCNVNTFSSIKDKKNHYEIGKIEMVEKGLLYPIPIKDNNLPRFSGIDKRVLKNIPLSSVKNVGYRYLKRRHHHYIQKYMK